MNVLFCHLCKVMLRAATLNKLGLKRNNHINRTHKGVSHDQFYTVRPRVSIVQSAPGRLMVGGWKCSMCLPKFFRRFRIAHGLPVSMLTWTTVFLVSNVFPTLRIAAESS